MEKPSQWQIPLAVVGAIIVTSMTFLQYVQAHREGHPGGYLPLAIGALFVGIVVSACTYFSGRRHVFSAIACGIGTAVLFIGVLLATITWSYGS